MNSGALAWMGAVALVFSGPRSSIGSPMTLMMRPRVSGPTGTLIGSPVSMISTPRCRPSVESMAMVRTEFSPRCWATSMTSSLPAFSQCRAFRMLGKSPSNLTSMTAPMIWVILPFAFLAISDSPLKRFRARDNFDQFPGDCRLTGAVEGQRQVVDHFAGVARRVVHGRHPCAVL